MYNNIAFTRITSDGTACLVATPTASVCADKMPKQMKQSQSKLGALDVGNLIKTSHLNEFVKIIA